MKNIDYSYLCIVIGNLAGIPIRTFENNRQVFYHSLVELPKDPLTPYRNEILSIETHIGYFITQLFHNYGVVNCPPHKIVIGP